MRLFILLFLLASCGKETEKCKSQEEMILRCQAEELSGIYFPTEYQIEMALAQCGRIYNIKSCY